MGVGRIEIVDGKKQYVPYAGLGGGNGDTKKIYTCQVAVLGSYIKSNFGASKKWDTIYYNDNGIGFRIFEADTGKEIRPNELNRQYTLYDDLIRIHDFSVSTLSKSIDKWWIEYTFGDVYSVFPNTQILFNIESLQFFNEKTPNPDWYTLKSKPLYRDPDSNILANYNGFFFQIIFEIEKKANVWIKEVLTI